MVRLLVISAVLVGNSICVAGDAPGEGESADTKLSLYPLVEMETTLGNFVLELNAEKAPITTMNFVWYVEDGFYEGTIFHRILTQKLIQGGGYLPDLEKKVEGLRPGIPNEWRNGLKNEQWTIAMSRSGTRPDSAQSQFFINLVDNLSSDEPRVDGSGIAVFGKVVSGFKTIARIRDAELTANPKYGGSSKTIPAEPVIIKSAKVTRDFDRDAIEEVARTHIGRLQKEREKIAQDNTRITYELAEKIEKETNSEMVTTLSGLKYVDLKVGTGRVPGPRDTVTVHYTGWLADGTEFQTSRHKEEPPTFEIHSAVTGWVEALQSMKVGGIRKLIVPSHLGYGPMGREGLIPPHAVLVYELELLGVEPAGSTTP